MICPQCHQAVPDRRPVEQCPNCLLARAMATSTQNSTGRAGPYTLISKLGEGSFGEVFFGEQHEPMYREAAVKLLKRDLLADTTLTTRFRAEAQALTVLDHPNIARLYEAGTTDSGQPFIALELISGTPITEWCKARDLGTDEKILLFRKVCGAIGHAHDRGLVHRDLKPENILVDLESGEPKVIDFGIARSTTTLLQKDAMLTGALDILGTPAYLSPEQTDGGSDKIDARSDIYALGVVLYELLTGRTPLDTTTDSHFELLRTIRETPAAPPSTIDSSIGVGLDATVLKALAKDREKRFQNVGELLEALDGNPPAPGSGRSKKTFLWAAITLAAVSAIFLLPNNPKKSSPSAPPEPAQNTVEPTSLAGYLAPFTLIAHDFHNVREDAIVAAPFSNESKFDWFHFRDRNGEDLLFAADIDYKSDAAGMFVLGAKSIELPGAETVTLDSETDRALLELLRSEYAKIPQDEWDRLEALSYDEIQGDSETRQRKLFQERYLSIGERRRNRALR